MTLAKYNNYDCELRKLQLYLVWYIRMTLAKHNNYDIELRKLQLYLVWCTNDIS